MADSSKGLYDHLYRRFFETRESHQGYDFQQGNAPNVPPPQMSFREKLAWWTIRGARRKQIMAERDRAQRAIVDMKAARPR